MGRHFRLIGLCLAGAGLLAGCTPQYHSYPDDAGAGRSSTSASKSSSTPAGAGGATPREVLADPFEDARRRIDEARSLPLPAGNYMVQVERVWFQESDSSAIGAMVGYIDENWNVGIGGASPDAGFGVGVAKDGFSAALDGHVRSSRGAVREQAFLTMVPDFPASLAIGQTRYVIPFVVGGVEYGMLVPPGDFVGTSLEVICQEAGEGRVQVTLTPVFSGIGPGGVTRVIEATTSVVVPLGQPLMIVSQNLSHNSVATSLLSRRSESGTEQAVLILTVK